MHKHNAGRLLSRTNCSFDRFGRTPSVLSSVDKSVCRFLQCGFEFGILRGSFAWNVHIAYLGRYPTTRRNFPAASTHSIKKLVEQASSSGSSIYPFLLVQVFANHSRGVGIPERAPWPRSPEPWIPLFDSGGPDPGVNRICFILCGLVESIVPNVPVFKCWEFELVKIENVPV